MSKQFIGALTIVGLTIMPNLLLMPVANAQDEAPGRQTVEDPMGYFLGISIGQQLRQSGFRAGDFGNDALLAGFIDGLADKDVALTDDQLKETQAKITSLLQQRQTQLIAEQKAKGEKFLAENAKNAGIKTLEGGVQYKVLTAGEGESPAPTDTVQVHYTGKLINGKVFDSSVQRGEPATFRVNQVIKGWQLALQKMQVGDKWMLYIPSDLAYGERGSQGAIGPNEVLVFEVELLAIQ
jgi:FKBP-type peptidyl-prolyl cis-trans isomerase